MAEIEKVIKQLKQLKRCFTSPCDVTCEYFIDDILCPCKYDVSADMTVDETIQTIRELQEQNKSYYEKGVLAGYEQGKRVALSKVAEFALEHGIYTSFRTEEFSKWVNELTKFEVK